MAITRSTYPTAAVLVRASQAFRPTLDLIAEALQRRRIRHIYGAMADAQLHDIGLTAQDVVVALALPQDRNAAEHLAKAAAAEAAKW